MPRPDLEQADATKVCPYCAETIKAAAIRCRYCRSDLEPTDEPAPESGPEPALESGPRPADETAPDSTREPVPETPPPPDALPAKRSSRRPPARAVAAVSVVAAVVALVLAGLAVRDVLHRRGLEEAVASARTVRATLPKQLGSLLSYDYRAFGDSRDAAEKLLTPDFRKRYLPTIDEIEKSATEQKRSQEAEVVAVAVVDQEPDEVTTLVFLNRTTSTEGSSRQRILQDRAVVTSVREDGAWRIDDITFPTS